MKGAETIILSCFSAERAAREQTDSGRLESAKEKKKSPRQKSVESVQRLGVEESPCIIRILRK